MLISSAWRRIAFFAFAVAGTLAGFSVSCRPVAAQATTPGSSAGPSAAPAATKTPTEWLIGDAVSEADSPQYVKVTDAITRFRNNDIDGARNLLGEALQKNPKLPPVEIMIARLLALFGQPGPGRIELEKAVMAHAEDPEAYLFFAETALQDRRVTDGEALLLEVKPLIDKFAAVNGKRKRNFDIRWNGAMAAVAEAREQWDTAAKYLAALIAMQPDSAVEVAAHQRLGRAMFKKGDRWDDVGKEYQKAVKLEAKSPNPYIALAYLYEEAKDHAKAVGMLKDAVDKNAKDLNVHLQAARLALSTGEIKDAQKYADAALAIDSNSVDGKVIRGMVARFSSPPDLKKAVSLLGQAREAAPKNLEASNQLALALIESSDKDDKEKALAIAELNYAATTHENRFNPEVASTYMWALYKNDHKTEAAPLLRQLLSVQQISPDTAYYIGKILQDEGDLDNAVRFLESAVKVPTPFAQRDATTKLLAEVKKEKDKKDSEKGSTPPSSSSSEKGEKGSEKGK